MMLTRPPNWRRQSIIMCSPVWVGGDMSGIKATAAVSEANARTPLPGPTRRRDGRGVTSTSSSSKPRSHGAVPVTRSLLALPPSDGDHAVGYFCVVREPRVFDLWLTGQPLPPRAH